MLFLCNKQAPPPYTTTAPSLRLPPLLTAPPAVGTAQVRASAVTVEGVVLAVRGGDTRGCGGGGESDGRPGVGNALGKGKMKRKGKGKGKGKAKGRNRPLFLDVAPCRGQADYAAACAAISAAQQAASGALGAAAAAAVGPPGAAGAVGGSSAAPSSPTEQQQQQEQQQRRRRALPRLMPVLQLVVASGSRATAGALARGCVSVGDTVAATGRLGRTGRGTSPLCL